jgi:uncharacterized protein YqgC (DUF456 family)
MADWLSTSIFWITLVLMLMGLFGLIIPLFPGIAIIWFAAVLYAMVTGFTPLGLILLIVITLLFIGGEIADNLLMAAKARKEGAAWSSLGLGMLAGTLATIFLTPIGGIIAGPLVVFLLEYYHHRDAKKALTALKGLAIGWGMAFVVRFLIGLVMIGLWLVWAFNR